MRPPLGTSVDDAVGCSDGLTMLDAGVGDGRLALVRTRMSARVTGVDASHPARIDSASRVVISDDGAASRACGAPRAAPRPP